MSRRCPNPQKRAYPTAAKARDALCDPRFCDFIKPPTGVYRCRCGSYHLTSSTRRNAPR